MTRYQTSTGPASDIDPWCPQCAARWISGIAFAIGSLGIVALALIGR